MKKLIMTGIVLAASAMSAYATEYTLAKAPQTLADWQSPATYGLESGVPGSGDVVILPANMDAKVDDSSIAFVSALSRIKPLNFSTSLLTIDIASDQELKCAFCNRGREWSSAAFTSGKIVKKGAGTLTLSSHSFLNYGGYNDYFTDFDIQEGAVKFYGETSSTYFYGRINVAANALMMPGANASSLVANYMISLSGAGTVSNGVGSATNCWLMPGYGEGKPSVFSGLILDKIRWYSHGYEYLTNPNNTFSGGFMLLVNNGTLTQGLTGATKFGKSNQPSSIGINSGISFLNLGGRFLYLGTGEETDKTISIIEDSSGKTYAGIVDAGATGGLVINGKVALGTAAVQRFGLDGSNTLASAINGQIERTGGVYAYLTKKGSGTWRLGHSNNAGLGGICVENGTLAFEKMDDAGYSSSLGDGSLFTVDKWVASGTAPETVPYLLRMGTTGMCGALEFDGSGKSSANSSSPMVLAGDGCLRNNAVTAAGKMLGWFYNAGISALTPGAKTLTLDGTNTAESVVGSVSNGMGTVSLAKTGSGTWVLAGTNNTFTGEIAVKAGKLIIRGVAGKFKFFRWTIKQIHSGKTVCVPEFGMWDKDNQRVNFNLSRNEFYSSASSAMRENMIPLLQPGEVGLGKALASTLSWGSSYSGDGLIDAMFKGTSYGHYGWQMKDQDEAITDITTNAPASWIPVVMRHAADANEVASYDYNVIGASHPRTVQAYTMEGSVDGFNWYLLDDVADAYWPASEYQWVYSRGGGAGTHATHSGGRKIAGSTNDVTVVYSNPVSVASGATVEADGLVELSSLKVGADGAGTVRGFVLGQEGVVDIANRRMQQLALKFEDCTGTDNLYSWSVSVGGVPNAQKRLAYKDGYLTVVSPGLLLFVQ